MTLQAIIFDMDGLLVDTEPVWEEAETEVFGAYGVQVTPDASAKRHAPSRGHPMHAGERGVHTVAPKSTSA